MQKITVQNNQSLLDVSVQATGSAANYIKIAKANDLVPTAKIAPGTIIEIPEDVEVNDDIVNFYEANGIVPTTEIKTEFEQEFIGIGEMEIGTTFKIR